MAALLGLALAGCGSAGISNPLSGSALDLFSTSSKATTTTGSTGAAPTDTDVECPDVEVRTGAATLIIGKNPKEAEPTPLDVRYQGTIIRTARECHVAAGMMTIKVGIEGRIITGPAGAPGNVDVPLRIAVVQEGVNPTTIVSKFGRETVTVNNAIDRVTFTHIDPDITFPLPQPLANIDAYTVYVGFDPLGGQPEKKKAPVKHKRAVKPKPTAQAR
ncbi:MAG TPA: hypothetical protein VG986_20975 [Pseudolabrys sp.]|nr:hypothetical protein [Pseudolabrys sp.]